MLASLTRYLGAMALGLILAGGLATAPSTTLAQDEAAQPTAEFSDTKLRSYVNAVVQVSAIVQEWRPKIQTARRNGDTQEMEKLKQQANAQLTTTIQDADGITLAEYKRISLAARQDKTLYDRLSTMIQDAETGN